MAKDAVATMGSILPDDAGGRDAVHVAVISAVAYVPLKAGSDVGFLPDFRSERGESYATPAAKTLLGIVDPFIKGFVKQGERFWLYTYPRTITGLNHQWSHPDIPDETRPQVFGGIYNTPAQKLASEQWLRNFCSSHDAPEYSLLMEIMSKIADGEDGGNDPKDDYIGWRHDGQYLTILGNDAHCEIPNDLWTHAEIVLGKEIKGPKADYFSCSC